MLSGAPLWAQVGCGGFNGAPQPSGGVNSLDNGSICLSDPTQTPAEIEIVASNVADGSNPNNFSVVIDWDDGSAREIIAFGGATTVINTGPHAYRIPSIKHQFLPRACNATAGRQCAYKPRVYLRIAGNICPAEFGNPPDFFRFNTDDQCSGQLDFTETGTFRNVFEVCAGVSTTVTFTDRTRLNCLPPQELTGLNASKRWRTFVYGTSNTITGSVLIAGSPQAFPFTPGGSPQISTEPLASSAPPFPVNVTQNITIPATAKVGEEFRIRMDYWNFCNQFPGSAPVSLEGIIRVVDRPAAPTATNQVVCNGTNPLPDFQVNFAAASSNVYWFRDNAGVPGAVISNPNGSNSKNLPASAISINNTTAGVYRVWASYRAAAPASSNGLFCESIAIPITLTIRESIPQPGPISGTADVCNGSTGVSYTVPIPAAAMPIGGATEYDWSVTDASNATVGDVTITPQADGRTLLASFNIANGTFAGSPSIVRKIRVRRRYVTGSTFPNPPASQCASSRADFLINVYRNTAAGTLTGGDMKCQGETLNPITWNPGVGNIVRWEISSNGGTTYSTIASFGTSTSVNPTTLNLAAGTYQIRANIQNGPCPALDATPVMYVINPNADVANAGADQDLCILTPPLITTLAGNAPVSGGVTAQWSVISKPGGSTVTFTNSTSPTSQITVNAPGKYVLQWKLQNATCQSVDEVEITFGQDPDTPVPTPTSFCALTGTLPATAPTKGEDILWTLVSGPGTATFSDATVINPTVTVSTFGTYRFNLKFSSGGCTPKNTNVDINFNQAATSNAGADQLVCGESFPISGTIGGGATQGRWEIDTGSGTFNSSSTATGSTFTAATINDTYQPSAGDLSSGFVILRLRALDPDGSGNCLDVTSTVRIDFDLKPPAAAVGADFSVCGSTANLVATAPTNGGIGVWSNVTAGPTIVSPGSPTSLVTGLVQGANQFRWTVNSAQGKCAATDAVLTITRPAPPVVNNQTISNLCETVPNSSIAQDVDLTAYNNAINGGSGLTVTWFRNAARTIAVPVPTQEDVADAAIYYVRVTDVTTCTSDGTVTFTINQAPFVANLTPSLCEDPATPGQVQNINLNTYNKDVSLNLWPASRNVTWFSDAALTTPVATPTDVDNVIDGQTFYARVENTVTGCFNVANVSFIINLLPTDNPIQGPLQACVDVNQVVFYQVTTLKANHTYQWTIPADVQLVTATDNFFVALIFDQSVPGNEVTLRVLETSPEGCPGNVQELKVKVAETPGLVSIVGDDVVCEGTVGQSYKVVPDNYPASTYNWKVFRKATNTEGGGFVANGQTSGEVLINFQSDDVYIQVQESNVAGCFGPAAVMDVVVDKRPSMLDDDRTICSDATTAITFAPTATSVAIAQYNILSVVPDPGVTPKVGPTSGLGVAANAIFADAYENLGAVPLTVNYTVQPVRVGTNGKECTGNSQILTIAVQPEPQLDNNLDDVSCSEIALKVMLTSAPNTFPADKFILDAVTFSAADLTPVANQDAADGTTLRDLDFIKGDVWRNTSVVNQTVTYSVRPYSTLTGCSGNPPKPVSVTVFPSPFVASVTPAPLCSGGILNIPLSANVPGTDFIWSIQSAPSFITGQKVGTGPVIGDVLTSTGSASGTVVYAVQARNPSSQGQCLGPIEPISVVVNPLPAAVSVERTDCSTTPGGTTVVADLQSLEPSIVTPDPLLTITWYQDAALTTVIAPPALNAFPVTNNVPVFARVSNTSTGCQQVVSAKYTVNPSVAITLTPSDYNGFNLSCAGNTSGEIKVDVQSGTGTPTYSFRINGEPFVNATGNTYTFKFLSAASHSIEVRDSKNCSATSTLTLTEPTPLTANLVINKEITCYQFTDGAVEIQPGGGATPYKNFTLLPNGTTQLGNAPVFSNLIAGTYTVRVTDNNNCTLESNAVVMDPKTPVQIIAVNVFKDANGFNLSCHNASDGQIEVQVTGGNGPDYDYTLTKLGDPTIPFREIISALNTETFTGLTFGTYTVNVKDKNGCTAQPGVGIITNPPDLNPGFIGINQSICSGDTPMEIQQLVPPFGGIGTYTFEWQQSPDGGGDVNNDADWATIGSTTSASFQPPALTAASTESRYYRRLVYSGNCPPKGKDTKVEIVINPLPDPLLTARQTTVCQGEPVILDVNLNKGTGPFIYDYQSATETRIGEVGTDPLTIIRANFQADETFTLLRFVDANGCVANNLPQSVSVTVSKVEPSFALLSSDSQCPESEFEFSWQVEDGVDYTWDWADGTSDKFPAGTLPAGLKTITHIFPPSSPVSAVKYPIRLRAQSGICAPKEASKTMTVFPDVLINLIFSDDILCGGETLVVSDLSLGVGELTMLYREVGTTTELEKYVGAQVPKQTYVMNNFTTQNPITYEFIYQGTNGDGCKRDFAKTVQVYRNINADFTIGPVPPLVAGASEVSFTNTSTPLDAGAFEYTWSFGDPKSEPATADGIDPVDVTYRSPGLKQVELRAVNVAARNALEKCESVKLQSITIIRPDLDAKFTATPLASCFPTDIVVTNTSPGANKFDWELYNENGLVAQSQLDQPVFRILKPGTYDIYLRASLVEDDSQEARRSLKGIEVYDVPSAIFEVRPNPIYVPDAQIRLFNFSARATSYHWDFDNGDTSDDFEPQYVYKLPGKYNIQLISAYDHGQKDVNGDGILDGNVVCYDTAYQVLNALDGGFIKLPNAFTPNVNGSTGGSGEPGAGSFNDVFLPITKGVEEFVMQIFDRWGNLIFESRDKNVGWDGYHRNGNLMPSGVYVYKLTLRLSDGQRTTKVGDVTLIR